MNLGPAYFTRNTYSRQRPTVGHTDHIKGRLSDLKCRKAGRKNITPGTYLGSLRSTIR